MGAWHFLVLSAGKPALFGSKSGPNQVWAGVFGGGLDRRGGSGCHGLLGPLKVLSLLNRGSAKPLAPVQPQGLHRCEARLCMVQETLRRPLRRGCQRPFAPSPTLIFLSLLFVGISLLFLVFQGIPKKQGKEDQGRRGCKKVFCTLSYPDLPFLAFCWDFLALFLFCKEFLAFFFESLSSPLSRGNF